jgi:hypothetical protein
MMLRMGTLIVGLIGLVLGGLVLLVSFVLSATSGGKISTEEALPGIIGGCACSGFGFLLAAVGLVLVLQARKASATPPASAPSTTTPSSSTTHTPPAPPTA